MNKQKGFTIIELIVVIAIIAVLAGIVLVNVTQYINKGRDAAIKGNLATALTNGADYFNTNSNYTSFTITPITTAITNAYSSSAPAFNTSSTAFCAAATLTDASKWCVDSTGYKGSTDNCTSSHFSCL